MESHNWLKVPIPQALTYTRLPWNPFLVQVPTCFLPVFPRWMLLHLQVQLIQSRFRSQSYDSTDVVTLTVLQILHACAYMIAHMRYVAHARFYLSAAEEILDRESDCWSGNKSMDMHTSWTNEISFQKVEAGLLFIHGTGSWVQMPPEKPPFRGSVHRGRRGDGWRLQSSIIHDEKISIK